MFDCRMGPINRRRRVRAEIEQAATLFDVLVDAVEFCRRGPTTDVLFKLRGLSRKLSGRRDRAVADVVDVALPVFGKLRVGKLEQALV